ncbi:hypothetical protein ACJA88_014624 [Fusarium oxysporum]
MANEYKQHLQCQTCFVRFSSNQHLLDHIEDYRARERLLLAELERCRMHLEKPNSEEQDDDESASHSPSDPLTCPYRSCSRNDPYTSRGNLVRHFQTHVDCYETCPFCFDPIVKVHRYNRHHHESSPDDPKSIFMEQRIANFNATVSKDLDRWQDRRSARKRGQLSPVSEQVQKKKKEEEKAPVSAHDTNLYPGPSCRHSDSVATKRTVDTMTTTNASTEPQREMISTSCVTDHVLAQKTSIADSNTNVLLHASSSMIGEDWSLEAATMGVTANVDWGLGKWAFAITTTDSESNEYPLGEWAFATPDPQTTNNTLTLGDWAFAQAGPVAASDSNWNSASTPARMPINEQPVPLDVPSEVSFVPTFADSARTNKE